MWRCSKLNVIAVVLLALLQLTVGQVEQLEEFEVVSGTTVVVLTSNDGDEAFDPASVLGRRFGPFDGPPEPLPIEIVASFLRGRMSLFEIVQAQIAAAAARDMPPRCPHARARQAALAALLAADDPDASISIEDRPWDGPGAHLPPFFHHFFPWRDPNGDSEPGFNPDEDIPRWPLPRGARPRPIDDFVDLPELPEVDGGDNDAPLPLLHPRMPYIAHHAHIDMDEVRHHMEDRLEDVAEHWEQMEEEMEKTGHHMMDKMHRVHHYHHVGDMHGHHDNAGGGSSMPRHEPHMLGGDPASWGPGRWTALDRGAPRPVDDGDVPAMNWNLWNDDGSLNLGLVAFAGLAGACAAVWSALAVQCAQMCWRHRCCTSRRGCGGADDNGSAEERQFLVAGGKAVQGGGVVVAAEHVHKGTEPAQFVMLQYAPLPSE